MFSSFRFFLLLGFLAFYFLRDDSSFLRTRRQALSRSDRCVKDNHLGLTFDEGPSINTRDILLFLRKTSAKVTFHISADNLRDTAFASHLKTAYTDGHVIGVRFKPSLDPRTLSDPDLKWQLQQQSDAIYNIIDANPKFIRFNYNQADDRVVRIANAMGFVVTTWTLDLEDTSFNNQNYWEMGLKIANSFMEIAPQRAGFVALARDLYPQTTLITPALVQLAVASGFEVVDLAKCMQTEPYRKVDGSKKPATQVTPSSAGRIGVAVMQAIGVFALMFAIM